MLSNMIPTALPTATPTTGSCAVCQRSGFKLGEKGGLSRHGYTKWRNGNRRACPGSHHAALEISDATLLVRAKMAAKDAAWAQRHLDEDTDEQLIAVAKANRWFRSVPSARSRLTSKVEQGTEAAATARELAATHPCNAPAPAPVVSSTVSQRYLDLFAASLEHAVTTEDGLVLTADAILAGGWSKAYSTLRNGWGSKKPAGLAAAAHGYKASTRKADAGFVVVLSAA